MTGWFAWALAGMGVLLGAFLIVAGLQPVERRARRTMSLRLPPITVRAVVAVLVGLGLAVLTGWVVWLILTPLAVLVLPRLLRDPANRDLEVMQAMDRWLRGLSALMATGRSVLDAIRLSRRSAPDLLREPLERLVSRLDDRWASDDALRGFADDIASPDADAAVAALMLASRRGQTGAGTTLNELSDSLQHRLRAWREIETERAKPRIVVRQVTVVMAVVLLAALLLGGDFFEPYGSPLGQTVLLAIVAAYLGSLVLLRRMTVPAPRERILSGASRTGVAR